MTIFVESQPQWLNFLKGNIDVTGVPKDAYDSAFDKTGTLKPEYAQKNIRVSKSNGADLILQVFNMTDPVLGKNKYLRKAISMAMNRETMISRFYNGRAIASQGPLPPDFEGYSADIKDPNGYNVAKAKEFINSPELKAKMDKGGLIGKPDFFFYKVVQKYQ